MKLKKIGMIAVSAVLVFGMTACGGEKEQPKKEEEQTTLKEEQTVVKKEPKPERIRLIGEEVIEKFPKLKEMEEYLFNQYPTLSREAQERGRENEDRQPIEFFYVEEGKPVSMEPSLAFEETVTKKEMIEAVKYTAKEIDSLFPEDSSISFRIAANIVFTEDGILDEGLLKKRGGITLKYSKAENGQESNLEWKEKVDVNTWVPFDPEEVKEGEELAYFGEEEQPQEEPAEEEESKYPKITAEELIGLMNQSKKQGKIEFEETSREQDEKGNTIIKGANEKGNYVFEIKADKEGNAVSGVYKVIRLPEMSEGDYRKMCNTYLTRSAAAQYTTTASFATYRYVGDAIEIVMNKESERSAVTIQDTKFELVSEEEGNCITMYVTNHVKQ